MKRILSLFIILILIISASIYAAAIDNPPFSVEITGTPDTDKTFNGQGTLVINWRIMANRNGLTLRNTQGLRLSYDITVLQLMKWDGSDVIADSSIVLSFNSASQTGRVGVYNTTIRVSAAKNSSGSRGYLNISLGDAYDIYACPQGAFVTLAQVRFAFSKGKTASDLAENSIRCMNAGELAATAQSSAILINTTENGATSYEFLRQSNSVATGGDKLNAPVFDYPLGTASGDDKDKPPDETSDPGKTDKPPDETSDPGKTDKPPNGTSDPGKTDNPPDGTSDPGKTEKPPDVTTDPGKTDNPPDGTIDPIKSGTPSSETPGSNDPAIPSGTIAQDGISDYSNPYSDVPSTAWFYYAVKFVTESNLMNGTGNNQFSPNISMTRSMFATILYRYAGRPNVSGINPFTDVADGLWYSDAVQWANEFGFMMGYGDSIFRPVENITREQVVTILYRYSEGFDDSEPPILSVYTDSHEISDWALSAVRWAVNTGIITGRSQDTLAPRGLMTRAEVAQILLNYI